MWFTAHSKGDVSYPVKVYQNTSYGVEEAWQLVDIVILPVRLSQVHLLAPLNELCIHQIYILRAHHLTRLKANKYKTQSENLIHLAWNRNNYISANEK